MTIYDLHTCITKIILYSGYLGFSGGIDFQAAVQTTLGPADINLTIEVILSGQRTGLPAFIAIGQVVLTDKLLSSSAEVVPGLTPTFIEQYALGDIKNGLLIQRWDGALGSIGRSSTHT
ncbi:Major facilitator superfamily domain general substrate transporter [Penicillium chrysogenum]|jgi:hypothetical protein|uniref:Major facilitator superfamily domain general substrate transporter n=1 Tax=Penicillium chrysogenum TaxID=5076 RepID=A0ABQ8W4A4_PENCH|nr:Major facilitator superfamily domain general substrate transporter [Penicillium chrysogenum]KAJ5230654.1 Major facilitator superfamily domain general substrate transporter [Penicillium chrysogenum]KAJ5254530.1 Major facilitator superfamily domain general substrate transporter [Penicillium chrysogenum]KAJ5268128.1 Major facilitator superfamily domain general substrate transporter [Penicillium chrysogenum]KAJ6163113.1 Major facilitator superfamily domain general substrate transporter [Penicill